MPKALKKKSVKAKAQKKTGKKPLAAKVHKKSATKEPSFMWKLLKQKEAERKRLHEEAKTLPMGHQQSQIHGHFRAPAFSKFSGPRRKVG